MSIRPEKNNESEGLKRSEAMLRREYLKNLLPLMLSVLGGTVNALIDSVFVSAKLGSYALAAINLSMPVYLLICCVGALLAGGGSVVAAGFLGDEKKEDAAGVYRKTFSIILLCGLVITVAGSVFAGPISVILARDDTLRLFVQRYISVIMLATLPFLLLYIPVFFLQLDGKASKISIMSVIMIVTDVALDWLTLYPLKMGIRGAALASAFSTAAACFYGFSVLGKKPSNFRLEGNWRKLPAQKVMKGSSGERIRGGIRDVVYAGSPMALGNLYDTIRLFLLNHLILVAGGAGMAAVWAVMNTLLELSMMITSGVPQAGAPMISAFTPTRENGGIRTLIRIECIIGTILCIIFTDVLVILRGPIQRISHSSENLTVPILMLCASVFLALFAEIWTRYFNAAGMIRIANVMVAARRLVFPVAAAYILYAAGVKNWAFLPVSGILVLLFGFAITYTLHRRTKGSVHEKSALLLLDDFLERENKVIDFSIEAQADAICDASEKIGTFCSENEMETKMANRISLSIEELLMVIHEKNPEAKQIDLRAFALPGMTGIRVRCGGREYDPFHDEENEDDFLMGVTMLEKMASLVTFTYALGLNTLSIFFDQ